MSAADGAIAQAVIPSCWAVCKECCSCGCTLPCDCNVTCPERCCRGGEWDDTPMPQQHEGFGGCAVALLIFLPAFFMSEAKTDVGPLSGCPLDFLSMMSIGFTLFVVVSIILMLATRWRARFKRVLAEGTVIYLLVMVSYAASLAFAIALYGPTRGLRCGTPLTAGFLTWVGVFFGTPLIFWTIYQVYVRYMQARQRLIEQATVVAMPATAPPAVGIPTEAIPLQPQEAIP